MIDRTSTSILVEKPFFFFFSIQASSPLQVKYADGELERLGAIYLHIYSQMFCQISLGYALFTGLSEHKLFIGMLPKNISESEVSDLFSKYGTIKDLQILRGPQQTSKGTNVK